MSRYIDKLIGVSFTKNIQGNDVHCFTTEGLQNLVDLVLWDVMNEVHVGNGKELLSPDAYKVAKEIRARIVARFNLK